MKQITITNGSVTFTIDQDEMSELEGWEYASVREAIEDIAGYPGSVYLTSKHNRRRFSITGRVNDMCLDDRREGLLAAIRQTGALKLLKFTTLDDLELQSYVEILSLRNPYSTLRKPFLIEMVAPDWRFYNQDESNVEVDADSDEDVTNEGNEITHPVLTITGPGTQFVIENTTTGESMTIVYTLLNGSSTIVIDMLRRKILLNNTTSIYSALTAGDFFVLQPGVNNIEFTVTGDDTSTKLDVDYRDAYNGV